MQQKKFKDALKDKSSFVVIVELTGGPNFNFAPIEGFLASYKDSKNPFPDSFNFVGITSTDNSGGTPNIEPADVLSHIKAKGLFNGLDFIPHISCKDKNSDALVSCLAGYKGMGIDSILVITGDKPVKGKRVFEFESANLVQMINEMNSQAYLKASPDELDDVHQFFTGVAVSPFKYTEASQMQQYYKMEKKIACGAKFIITQVGWDWKKSIELFRYLEENNLDVPIIGNVFLLSTTTPAPRLMHDLKLPGCFVSDELFAKLCAEGVDEHIERAAQQVAMYKSIGAAGVDVGSVHDFNMFVQILERAKEIGDNWEEYKDNLYWPKEGGFYLYDDAGHYIDLSTPKKKFSQKFFNFMHRNFLNPERKVFRITKKLFSATGAQKNKGFVYESFNALEYVTKHLLFDCEMCGDCYLPENFGLCTIGGCEKGLSNAPCGDATVDGYCGNNLELTCIGERIFNAAASEPNGIEQWQATINKPRIHSLEQTSSILNHMFVRDHGIKAPFISIGELIHASIPKTGGIMKQLHELGADAYSKPSGVLNYVKAMIESQVAGNADYIAINLDAFSSKEPQNTIDMMNKYVRMVRNWGWSTPVCIDSNDKKILIAGLEQWYNTDHTVKPPLLSSIKIDTIDEIMTLKKSYDYKFSVLLGDNKQFTSQSNASPIEQQYLLAKQIFDKAIGEYGFRPDEIFFELDICPLASDLPQNDIGPGHTHVTFETAKKIKHDRRLADAHCLMRPSVVGRKLPRSLGVCRAYVGKALEYGFDAAFVDVAHRFGMVQPATELVELVDAYAKMDGSTVRKEKATTLMDNFYQQNKKKS